MFMIILLLTSLSTGSNVAPRISIPESLPDYLAALCPHSNVCGTNSSIKVSSDEHLIQCCTDCSCGPECEDTGDCCFLPDDNNSGINAFEECLFPKTGVTIETDSFQYHSYRMVSSCPECSEDEDCGNQKVAPWGSFYPVFSKRTGTIYKNMECAKLNNVVDGIVWDARLECTKLKGYGFVNDFSDLAWAELQNYCKVRFIYPGELNDIKFQTCFRDMVDNCTTTEFKVPVSINASRQQISEFCQSGLVSPYFADRNHLYSNVFCYICSGLLFKQDLKCNDFRYTDRDPGSKDFFAILNFNALQNIPFKENSACPNDLKQNISECRPVLCPTGQIRNATGHCIFTMKMWIQQYCRVAIELKSDVDFDIQEVFVLLDDQNMEVDLRTLSFYQSRKQTKWTPDDALYEITGYNNDTKTKSLLVYMTRYISKADPEYVVKSVTALLTTKWRLEFKNKTLTLIPSIFKQLLPYTKDGKLVAASLNVNNSSNETISLYKQLYKPASVPGKFMPISKLCFCEQIELRTGEYYLSDDQSIVYNIIGKNYLFNAEFDIIQSSSEISVRICLENSGFGKQSENTAAANCAKVYNFIVFAVFVLTCFY